MDVYFLRHGKAEKHADCDEDRALKSKGRETISCLGGKLRALKISPTHLYTSPYLRALQTAEILNESFAKPLPLEITPTLGCGTGTHKILDLLAPHAASDRIVLVGHMPDFAEITRDLLQISKAIAFETGSFVGLQWRPSQNLNCQAHLILELHPSQYAED